MQKMWIGGRRVASTSRRSFPVTNPATEQVIDRVPRAGRRDVNLAVEAAAAAFGAWRFMPGIERAALMREFAARLRARRKAIARQMTLEGGKPLIENLDEVEWCAAAFEYYGELARDQGGKVISPVFRNQINFVRKEPYGVVVAIVCARSRTGWWSPSSRGTIRFCCSAGRRRPHWRQATRSSSSRRKRRRCRP
jgi:betaine-aldehyde dehydrogenase